jgi:NAD(P)-dependent dehydrogenase (short-subunit alcohol dehydrogenase family)
MSDAPPAEPRTALVTGATSGIGAAIALAFGRLGWRVALGGRRLERLRAKAAEVEAAGGTVLALPLEMADPASIDAFFDTAEKELGPADVLVNNAGTCIPGLLHEVRPDDLRYEAAANLVGPMLLARRAVRSLLERGARGDLVFISSENAVRPRPYQVGYTATKMGLEGVARALRMELEGTGIRSIIVRPGPTGTEFARDWDPAVLERLLEVWRRWGVQRHLRWMPPSSVADAVLAAVLAPPGTRLDVVELMPEDPPPEEGRPR